MWCLSAENYPGPPTRRSRTNLEEKSQSAFGVRRLKTGYDSRKARGRKRKPSYRSSEDRETSGETRQERCREMLSHFEPQTHIMLHFETHKISKYLVDKERCMWVFSSVSLRFRKSIYKIPLSGIFWMIFVYMGYFYIQYVQCCLYVVI